jgi:hypothetical protein
MHRAIILATALLLAACDGGDSLQWVKQGADARQLQIDRDYCTARSQRDSFLDASRGGFDQPTSNRMARFGEADSYRACMTQLGWHRERVAAQ